VALEDLQRRHNRVISNVGNYSASNDPFQVQHDANEKLIAGARKLAAGQQLGLSEEETLALVSNMARRQKRADGQPMTEADALRKLQQTAATLADGTDRGEIRGVGYADELDVDPFGQDQSDFYQYGPDDRQFQSQQIENIKDELASMEDRDNKDRTRYEKGQAVLKTGVNPDEYDDLREDLSELLPERDQMTPRAALQGTLAELNAANEANKQQSGLLSRVFGGGNEDLEGYAQVSGALEDAINFGRVQRDADASIGGELARRDSGRFDKETQIANQYRSAAEAEAIARDLFTIGGRGAQGDLNIAALRTQPTKSFGQIGIGPSGAYIDETGNTVAVQGPERPPAGVISGSNTPDTAQALNAPQPQTAIDYVAKQLPDFTEGGRVYGDYPQVDITGVTTELADRIRGLKIKGQTPFSRVSPQIRSVDELQRVVDAVVELGTKGGAKFSTKEVNPDTGRMVNKINPNPGAQEVMNFMRYTPAEQGRIANALFQMEAARRSGYNAGGKEQYFSRTGGTGFKGDDITFNAPDALPLARPDEQRAEVARINPGQTIEGRDIGTRLRELESPGARQPFIGAVIDPRTRKPETVAGPGYINRYNRTGATGEDIAPALRAQEVERAKGKPIDIMGLRNKVTKARLVDERARRDSKKRAQREADMAARRGPAPSEPGLPSAVGYGDELRQVISDARRQSANMSEDDKFVETIRRIRGRRG